MGKSATFRTVPLAGEPMALYRLYGTGIAGEGLLSKSMNQMIDYADHLKEGLALETESLPAEESRNRAEWAKMMAAEILRQGTARSKNVRQPNGESYQPQAINSRPHADYA